jgi:hypothetical protein
MSAKRYKFVKTRHKMGYEPFIADSVLAPSLYTAKTHKKNF